MKPIIAALLVLLGWSVIDHSAASARQKSHSRDHGPAFSKGWVSACSRFGNGCVSGPVRPARFGYQVRKKSGTWIDCKRDCGAALLEETIDFWDSQEEKALIATH